MREFWELYSAFFRIGILTFGGGLTMLPMLKYELVEKRKWITEDVLLDCYAIGQCTPGIIAVNTATFVGYNAKKSLVSPICVAICAAAFILVMVLNIPTVLVIVLAAVAGVVIDRVKGGVVK